jgi:hypothetical protein
MRSKGVSENPALFAANYSAACALPQCRNTCSTASCLKKGWSPAYLPLR